MSELKRTPLYQSHIALGARLVPFAGWEMPVQYQGVSSEHRAVRSAAGLFDVCHMGELRLTGAAAIEQTNRLITNDLSRLASGRAMYTCCTNEAGMILDDLIVYRLTDEEVPVVCNASNRGKISSHFRQHVGGDCDFADESDDTALMALQGPRAVEIFAELSNPSVSEMPSFSTGRMQALGIDCQIARTGYTGEDGLEIFCRADRALQLWNAILEAGEARGVAPVGLGARDTLRLEARLSLYGNEIDETTHPFEAGLGWVVKLDGPDFIGRDALRTLKNQALSRRLAGFEMTGRGIARHGYPLLNSAGQRVGICTSGAPSPTLGKSIGLGYLPVDMTQIGTEFSVDCRGRTVGAKVVKTPFYKRPKPS